MDKRTRKLERLCESGLATTSDWEELHRRYRRLGYLQTPQGLLEQLQRWGQPFFEAMGGRTYINPHPAEPTHQEYWIRNTTNEIFERLSASLLTYINIFPQYTNLEMSEV